MRPAAHFERRLLCSVATRPSHHLQTWADLLNATGGTTWKKEGFLIENCHDNTTKGGGEPGTPGNPGYPYWEGNVAGGTLHCPMNFWLVLCSRDTAQ